MIFVSEFSARMDYGMKMKFFVQWEIMAKVHVMVMLADPLCVLTKKINRFWLVFKENEVHVVAHSWLQKSTLIKVSSDR